MLASYGKEYILWKRIYITSISSDNSGGCLYLIRSVSSCGEASTKNILGSVPTETLQKILYLSKIKWKTSSVSYADI